MIRRALTVSHHAAWGLLVFSLFGTSLPLVANLIRTNSVAPAAALFAGWLVLTWLIPFFFQGGRLPRQVLPFLLIVLVILVASFHSFFLEIPPFKGRSPTGEGLDALVTLAVGSAFYFIAALFPNDPDKLKTTQRWLNWGGLVIILWSGVQVWYVFCCDSAYPDWVRTVHSWFSLRRLFQNRLTGLAYEPSWLAHQLNILYLPVWLSAVLKRRSAHRTVFGKFIFEDFLFVGGVLTLFFSFSRVGWLAFGIMLAYVAAGWIARLLALVRTKIATANFATTWVQRTISILLIAAILAAAVLAGAGLIQLGGRFDPRLSQLADKFLSATSFWDLTGRLGFAERVVFWATGWEVFSDHPFLGVGLGNTGFYFPKSMPSFGYFLNEVNDIFYYRDFIPNTKSIWVRLLSETGILGFSCFLAWLYVLWQSAKAARDSRSDSVRVFAQAGTFALVTLLVEGFSIDSFALPYIWIALGLLTAAANVWQREDSLPP